MKPRLLWITGFLIAAVLLFLPFYNSAEVAPDVHFITIEGKKITLKSLKGKPVLITFWATDCPACIQKIPDLISLHNRFQPQGLEIIAVAMGYNPPNLVVEMAKTRNLPYTVALDLKFELAKAFGDVNLIPHSFLISPDGLIVQNQLGNGNMKTTERLIENFLQG